MLVELLLNTCHRPDSLSHQIANIQSNVGFRNVVYYGLVWGLLFLVLLFNGSNVQRVTEGVKTSSTRRVESCSHQQHQRYPEPLQGAANDTMESLTERAVVGSRFMLLPRGDGFGTQVQTLLSALAYCRIKNLTYIHQPWETVGHRPPELLSSAKWSADLEAFTGLVDNEIRFSDSLGPVPAARIVRIDETNVDQYFSDEFLQEMRTRYLASSFPRNHSASFLAARDTIRVAVHARRGDVGPTATARYTTNTQLRTFMDQVQMDIQKDDPSRPITFHIYSEGDAAAYSELFDTYGADRVFLHLNEDLKTTFYDMTTANILIMAKSSLSYSAALLSAGQVYSPKFALPALRKWRALPQGNE